MSDITTGRFAVRNRTLPSMSPALNAMVGPVRAAWGGLRARRLAAETRRATDALDSRLRDDIGVAPRASVTPAIPPEADAWMR